MKWPLTGVLVGTFLINIAIQSPVLAAGVVTNSDEASLRTALAGGGNVMFDVDGTITVTNPIVITNATVIDGTGHDVIISGNSNRLFELGPGVALDLRHLTLANGFDRGTNGSPNVAGGPGRGGAIYNNGGTLSATDCSFRTNLALGGTGGDTPSPFFAPGKGGAGQGGAVYSLGGTVS